MAASFWGRISPTATAAAPVTAIVPTTTEQEGGHVCSSCGHVDAIVKKESIASGHSEEDKRKIVELEAEIARLTGKTTELVDRIADQQDEITRLHRKQKDMEAVSASALSPTQQQLSPPPQQQSAAAAAASKFSYFLSRRATPSPATENHIVTGSGSLPTSPGTAGPSLTVEELANLQRALDHEKILRQEAESQVSKISGELDELSAVLFQQANEMVAAERKERSKLEKRVAELEQRDREKMARLQNIEKAVDRINRVRGILTPTINGTSTSGIIGIGISDKENEAPLVPISSSSSLSASASLMPKRAASPFSFGNNSGGLSEKDQIPITIGLSASPDIGRPTRLQQDRVKPPAPLRFGRRTPETIRGTG